MHKRFIVNILKPFGLIRPTEAQMALLMFLYSFTVMTAYNAIKPAMRSQFIKSLDPTTCLTSCSLRASSLGFAMASYSRLITRLPHRWCLTIAQSGITAILLGFWILFRSTQAKWVSVAFYLFGSILAILLISQFWTLANIVFDPRQAKRLFGFIAAALHSAAFLDPSRPKISRLGSALQTCSCLAPASWC